MKQMAECNMVQQYGGKRHLEVMRIEDFFFFNIRRDCVAKAIESFKKVGISTLKDLEFVRNRYRKAWKLSDGDYNN